MGGKEGPRAPARRRFYETEKSGLGPAAGRVSVPFLRCLPNGAGRHLQQGSGKPAGILPAGSRFQQPLWGNRLRRPRLHWPARPWAGRPADPCAGRQPERNAGHPVVSAGCAAAGALLAGPGIYGTSPRCDHKAGLRLEIHGELELRGARPAPGGLLYPGPHGDCRRGSGLPALRRPNRWIPTAWAKTGP